MSEQLSYAGRAPYIETFDGAPIGFDSKQKADEYRAFRHGLMAGMTLGHAAIAETVLLKYRFGTLPDTPEGLTRLDWDMYRGKDGQ